jgi:hypothetical protein
MGSQDEVDLNGDGDRGIAYTNHDVIAREQRNCIIERLRCRAVMLWVSCRVIFIDEPADCTVVENLNLNWDLRAGHTWNASQIDGQRTCGLEPQPLLQHTGADEQLIEENCQSNHKVVLRRNFLGRHFWRTSRRCHVCSGAGLTCICLLYAHHFLAKLVSSPNLIATSYMVNI